MTSSLSSLPVWQNFTQAAQAASLDPQQLRLLKAASLFVDLSAQRDSPALQAAAEALLQHQGFHEARSDFFSGALVNWTEKRAAWHTALRAARPPEHVAQANHTERERVQHFVRQADEKRQFSSILHLGIGGSDWGPRMVIQALRTHPEWRKLRFASNVDGHAIDDALRSLDPHDTLIIVASKTFNTTEPLANAQVAIEWLRQAGVTNPLERMVAVTANEQAALAYGIAPQRIFKFWDWVGGRYSLWSAIGLPIALALGPSVWDELLAGGAAMDDHFLHAPYKENAPLQMALAGVVNRSVLGYASLALIPYDARLTSLVPWAQQLEMESLGKIATRDGSPVSVPVSPAVWGLPGTDAQHTFFQWLHQEAKGAPVDFILCQQPGHSHARNHTLLIANCLAQRAALLRGKSFDEALAETQTLESDPQKAATLARHRVHMGGRPSTLIVLPQLNARTLGALLALYEHKVFAQGVIWGTNPFDQWGVEFGKFLAKNIIRELSEPGGRLSAQDHSTQYWIDTLSHYGVGKIDKSS